MAMLRTMALVRDKALVWSTALVRDDFLVAVRARTLAKAGDAARATLGYGVGIGPGCWPRRGHGVEICDYSSVRFAIIPALDMTARYRCRRWPVLGIMPGLEMARVIHS